MIWTRPQPLLTNIYQNAMMRSQKRPIFNRKYTMSSSGDEVAALIEIDEQEISKLSEITVAELAAVTHADGYEVWAKNWMELFFNPVKQHPMHKVIHQAREQYKDRRSVKTLKTQLQTQQKRCKTLQKQLLSKPGLALLELTDFIKDNNFALDNFQLFSKLTPVSFETSVNKLKPNTEAFQAQVLGAFFSNSSRPTDIVNPYPGSYQSIKKQMKEWFIPLYQVCHHLLYGKALFDKITNTETSTCRTSDEVKLVKEDVLWQTPPAEAQPVTRRTASYSTEKPLLFTLPVTLSVSAPPTASSTALITPPSTPPPSKPKHTRSMTVDLPKSLVTPSVSPTSSPAPSATTPPPKPTHNRSMTFDPFGKRK